jgi:hypothetical protein
VVEFVKLASLRAAPLGSVFDTWPTKSWMNG